MKTISAYKARTNFGELLNEVFYKGEEIVVERKGKPMAKITPFRNKSVSKTKRNFMKLAGVWKDLDADKMITEIYKARRDGSRNKKFLLDWSK